MKAIGAIAGIGLSILDMIGIVSGFTMFLGHGIGALLLPPYGIYLGFTALFG